ncbi:hypothetical protein [Caudoviricetes sp.]|nr:hypothetical protein [Caudoviricetes sp.]
MQLTHEEMILMARLLGNHVVGYGPLMNLGEKLLDYAERCQEKADPLEIEEGFSGHRWLTFRHKETGRG